MRDSYARGRSAGLRRRVRSALDRVTPLHPELPVESLVDRYADGASAFVEVDGLRVHYRDEGPRDAPVLVALHGTFSSLHTWDGWVRALSDEFRVVRLDLPGFGLTGPHPDGEHTVEGSVGFLDRFLAAVGVETCVLAGNSRGGEIAWRYALAHPDRLQGLVLVDASGYPFEDPPLSFWLVRLPGVRTATRWVTPRALVRSNLRSAYGDPERVDEETVRRYHDLLRRSGVRDAHLDMIGTDTSSARADEIPDVSVPTLILWGERDEWIDPANARRFLRDLPDARLVTYADLGHVPMEEAPARTAADVREFLRELGTDRSDDDRSDDDRSDDDRPDPG